jgi:hypothetical protein
MWRVRVAPLLIVGSRSLNSIYWITINTCNLLTYLRTELSPS